MVPRALRPKVNLHAECVGEEKTSRGVMKVVQQPNYQRVVKFNRILREPLPVGEVARRYLTDGYRSNAPFPRPQQEPVKPTGVPRHEIPLATAFEKGRSFRQGLEAGCRR